MQCISLIKRKSNRVQRFEKLQISFFFFKDLKMCVGGWGGVALIQIGRPCAWYIFDFIKYLQKIIFLDTRAFSYDNRISGGRLTLYSKCLIFIEIIIIKYRDQCNNDSSIHDRPYNLLRIIHYYEKTRQHKIILYVTSI